MLSLRWLAALGPLLFAAMAGCAAAEDEVEISEGAGTEIKHWSHADQETWHELDPKWDVCKNGKRQSPLAIDVVDIDRRLARLEFDYAPIPLVILNNGHTIKAQGSPTQRLKANGKTYELTEMHFHAESEHTLGKHRSPLELHLVHNDVNNREEFAVVALLFERGAKNGVLEPIFTNAPIMKSKELSVPNTTIDLPKLVASVSRYATYPGSFTTPPCTESVTWYVVTTTFEVSRTQLEAYQTAMPGDTFRRLQTPHERTARVFSGP